ncbi:MAG: di-heme oxidoredictase family protein [Planctomycetota bacterium]
MSIRFIVSAAALIALACGNQTGAHQPDIVLGRALFERDWPVKDPRFGGDGLGPLFNGQSCVACHNQGGVGGGGEAEFNANTVGIESIQIKGAGIDDDVIAKMVGAFHPAFVQSNGTVINTFTIPHRGGTSAFRHLADQLYQHVPTERGESGGSASASEVRHSYATPILFEQQIGQHRISLRARLFQRNTTSLFGAGLIDKVTDKQIVAQAKAQKSHPEIHGRPSTLSNGRIGRFGWRGNVESLVQFVDQACANEIGLETRRKPQATDPMNRAYRNSDIDITDDQIESMRDFIAALPAPQRRIPETKEELAEVVRGEQVFANVGCAVCHVPNLGVAQGIYSDLLLHEMGNELIDLNHAEPYAVRRTPIMKRVYTQAVTTERFPGAGSMGAYYGETTVIRSTDRVNTSQALSRRRVSTGDRRRANAYRRDYSFNAPDKPSQLIRLIDIYSDSSSQTNRQTLLDGRRQTTEDITSLDMYIRVHYEPTMFNQEWRTPPLWGVADSAPYMHDGRAGTLLEAISMHDGESAGTRDRFLNLSLSDRRAVIAFLESLVAPTGVPQPQK